MKYITFECASRCNMDCKFCFSEWREQSSELDTEKAKGCLRILRNKGLEAINFTGGEPLLRKDISELIRFAKEIGLTTILSTNGLLLKQRLPEFAESIDFIGLPLDSDDKKIHNDMRPTKIITNHFGLILDLIQLINSKYSRIGIKINTLVSKRNMDNVNGIGKLIDGKVVSWKLSQFIPGAFGNKHKEEFEIALEDYITIADQCVKAYPALNIIHSNAYSRDSGCRILSFEGHLLKPMKNKLIDLGQISERIEDNEFNQVLNEYFLNKTYPKEVSEK